LTVWSQAECSASGAADWAGADDAAADEAARRKREEEEEEVERTMPVIREI